MKHSSLIAASTLVILLGSCTTNPARHALPSATPKREITPPQGRVLADFTEAESAKPWLQYSIEGVEHRPTTSILDGALHLTTNDAAGVYFFETKVDPAQEPFLGWRWRVSEVFSDASPYTMEHDNFPARVLVGFDASWDGADEMSLIWKRKVEEVIGRTPPARALCYNFGGNQAAGEAVDALIGMGRIVVINLRPADAKAGQWYSELRDVAADYAAVFGTKAPAITYLAISADTHRNHRNVNADFDDFTAYPFQAYDALEGRLGESVSSHAAAPLAPWLAAGFALLALGFACAGVLWFRRRRTDEK